MNPVAKIYYLSVSADVLAAFRLGDEDLSELQRKSLVVAIERLRLKSLNNKEAANSLISEAKKYGGLSEYLKEYFAIQKGVVAPKAQTFSPDLSKDLYQRKSREEVEDDSDYYLLATEELDKDERQESVWAKAMALCEGDVEKARYRYISLRVEQLRAPQSETLSSQSHHSVKPHKVAEENKPLRADSKQKPMAGTSGNRTKLNEGAQVEEATVRFGSFSPDLSNLKHARFYAKEKGVDLETLIAFLEDSRVSGKKIEGEWYVDRNERPPRELYYLKPISRFSDETRQAETIVENKIERGKYKARKIAGKLFVDTKNTEFPLEFSLGKYADCTGIHIVELIRQLEKGERKGYRIGDGKWEVAYDVNDFQGGRQADKRNRTNSKSNAPYSYVEKVSFIGRLESLGNRDIGDKQYSKIEKDSTSTEKGGYERESVEQESIFRQFLRGDLGLARMFWVFGVLVHVVSALAGALIVEAGATSIALGIGILKLIYWPLLLIGLWRAARAYSGIAVWALLAQVAVAIGLLWYVGGVAQFLVMLPQL